MASKRVTELHLTLGFQENSLSTHISRLDQEALSHHRAWHHALLTSHATNALEVQKELENGGEKNP